jgi:hypothetical protein
MEEQEEANLTSSIYISLVIFFRTGSVRADLEKNLGVIK